MTPSRVAAVATTPGTSPESAACFSTAAIPLVSAIRVPPIVSGRFWRPREARFCRFLLAHAMQAAGGNRSAHERAHDAQADREQPIVLASGREELNAGRYAGGIRTRRQGKAA